MSSDLFGAHLPWSRREQYLALILELGLVPEIAFKSHDLDALDSDVLATFAARLAAAGIKPTVHAPFFDLNPGALDPLVRQATLQRLIQTLEVAERLKAHTVIFHPGFDPWRYPGLEQLWVDNAFLFFKELLTSRPSGSCRLAIENIYEPHPGTLVTLVNRLDSKRFGHCFDIGHWHMFGKIGLDEWLYALGTRLFHLHLHDNHGDRDAHLPLGEGSIDFPAFFTLLAHGTASPSMTLEAHSPDDLQVSCQRFRRQWPL